jgi:hypothetical protein
MGHQMDICLKVHEIKSALSVQALIIFKFKPAFVKKKVNTMFPRASLETLTIS